MRSKGFAAAVFAVGMAACSAQVAPPAAPTMESEIAATEHGGVRREAVTIRATVEDVDQKSRRVRLIGADGSRETITLGDEVRNFAQIRKGDEVVVVYYQAAAFDVLAKDAAGAPAQMAEGLAAAEAGQMPGAAAAAAMTMVVEVLGLDPDRSTASIRTPEGETLTINIRNPAVFEKAKVGDRVEIAVLEAIAIDVRRADDN
jgi:hypothetical protein